MYEWVYLNIFTHLLFSHNLMYYVKNKKLGVLIHQMF